MNPVQFPAYSVLGAASKTGQASAPAEADGGSPQNPVAKGASEFKTALKEAEAAAMRTAVTGADPHAMVEALANAEMMLDTVTAVRDKVVEAYQELLRMPV